MNGRMIKRHTKLSIFLHWFNAASWIFLLATGIGLIKNPDLQPVGMWWSNLMWTIFGSGENLLLAHVIGGMLWAGVFLIYTIVGIKQVALFLREIFSYSPVRDFMWLVKKGVQMTLGTRALKKFGEVLEKRGASPEIAVPRIPDQGFYNVGQKMFAVPSVLGGVVIVITGIIMALSNVYFTNTAIVRWAILIHFITVGLVFAGLLIHIYMAAIAAGERPAFISMFTGSVPEDYAKHHHRLWYEKVKEN
jgi:formate dehydrogenase subunit gamma